MTRKFWFLQNFSDDAHDVTMDDYTKKLATEAYMRDTGLL